MHRTQTQCTQVRNTTKRVSYRWVYTNSQSTFSRCCHANDSTQHSHSHSHSGIQRMAAAKVDLSTSIWALSCISYICGINKWQRTYTPHNDTENTVMQMKQHGSHSLINWHLHYITAGIWWHEWELTLICNEDTSVSDSQHIIAAMKTLHSLNNIRNTENSIYVQYIWYSASCNIPW